jgi:hypothetical protein
VTSNSAWSTVTHKKTRPIRPQIYRAGPAAISIVNPNEPILTPGASAPTRPPIPPTILPTFHFVPSSCYGVGTIIRPPGSTTELRVSLTHVSPRGLTCSFRDHICADPRRCYNNPFPRSPFAYEAAKPFDLYKPEFRRKLAVQKLKHFHYIRTVPFTSQVRGLTQEYRRRAQ